MADIQFIVDHSEGTDRRLIDMPSLNLSEGNEANHETPKDSPCSGRSDKWIRHNFKRRYLHL